MPLKQLPKFLRKLYWLLDNHQYSDIISWDYLGQNILIKDQIRLYTSIIPEYFSLKKFSSFVRQLHLYDFHKVKSKNYDLVFYNSLFTRDERSQALKIKRKRKTKSMKLAEQNNDCKQNIATVCPQYMIPLCQLKLEPRLIGNEIQCKNYCSLDNINVKLEKIQEDYFQHRYCDIFDDII